MSRPDLAFRKRIPGRHSERAFRKKLEETIRGERGRTARRTDNLHQIALFSYKTLCFRMRLVRH